MKPSAWMRPATLASLAARVRCTSALAAAGRACFDSFTIISLLRIRIQDELRKDKHIFMQTHHQIPNGFSWRAAALRRRLFLLLSAALSAVISN